MLFPTHWRAYQVNIYFPSLLEHFFLLLSFFQLSTVCLSCFSGKCFPQNVISDPLIRRAFKYTFLSVLLPSFLLPTLNRVCLSCFSGKCFPQHVISDPLIRKAFKCTFLPCYNVFLSSFLLTFAFCASVENLVIFQPNESIYFPAVYIFLLLPTLFFRFRVPQHTLLPFFLEQKVLSSKCYFTTLISLIKVSTRIPATTWKMSTVILSNMYSSNFVLRNVFPLLFQQLK